MSRGDRVRTSRTRPAALVPRQPERPAQRLHVEVQQEAKQARLVPGADGREIVAKITGTTTTGVRHGLGRTPKGWRINRASGAPPDFNEFLRNSDMIWFNKSSIGNSDVVLWVW